MHCGIQNIYNHRRMWLVLTFLCALLVGQNRLLKDDLEQLKARTASDARLQQKLQQDLINLEKVRLLLKLNCPAHELTCSPLWLSQLLP